MFNIGDKVIFSGCSIEQQRWGGNSKTDELLIGNEYTVSGIDVHTWHTKIQLKEVKGAFNSVCFSDKWGMR